MSASAKGLSEREIQAISFSVPLLIKNKNPNADLIAVSLQALEGHWSKERIRERARAALSASTVWLEDECKACKVYAEGGYPKTASRREIAIAEANDVLRKKARQ